MVLMACADLVGGTTEQSCIIANLICQYQLYKTLSNCLHRTLDVPQPFLLFIAANVALAGCLGWKWSLWPVPTWLVVQRSKAVFLITLNVSINDMKHFRAVYIIPQPCHSHFWRWFLSIWPELDDLALNGTYGLCQLGWWYNEEKLYFPWLYLIVSMIWTPSELYPPQLCHSHFCCWLLQIWP